MPMELPQAISAFIYSIVRLIDIHAERTKSEIADNAQLRAMALDALAERMHEGADPAFPRCETSVNVPTPPQDATGDGEE